MIRSNSSGFVARAVLGRRDAVELGVGQVGERGLEVRVAVADEQDPSAAPAGGTIGPGPVVDGQRVGARRVDGSSLATRRTSITEAGWSGSSMSSIEMSVLPLRVQLEVAGLAQHAVARRARSAARPCSRSRLATETNAECDRPLTARSAPRGRRSPGSWSRGRPGAPGPGASSGAGRRRREGRVRRDQDLGVARARRQRGREPQGVAQVPDVGGRP